MREEAKRMKQAVSESGLSYASLEKATGISHSTLQRYLVGKTDRIPIFTIEKIAIATGVSAAWIMGWDAEKEVPSMTVGEKISSRRATLGLTLEEVGNAVGVGKSTVRKWELGYISNMRRDKIEALAKVLQIDSMQLISDLDTITPIPSAHTVPLLGAIVCDEPILTAENYDGEVAVPNEVKANLALRFKGDSMINAHIRDGDIVYIRQQDAVENGEIAAVLIDGKVTLKRFFQYDDRILLMPANDAYAPLSFSGEQLSKIRVIGKTVAFLSRIR